MTRTSALFKACAGCAAQLRDSARALYRRWTCSRRWVSREVLMRTCMLAVAACLMLASCGSDAVPGLTTCGQQTVNLFSDPQHCGSCENACGAAAPNCAGGVC